MSNEQDNKIKNEVESYSVGILATVENGRFDVNDDGKVDLMDMVNLGDQYTISPYNNEYDATYDLNCDQIVDETDMQLLADVVYG